VLAALQCTGADLTAVPIIFASRSGDNILCKNRTREKYQAIKYGGDKALKTQLGIAVTKWESGEL